MFTKKYMIHEFIFSMVHIKILQHEIHLMNSYEIKRDKKQKSVKMSLFASSKGKIYKQTCLSTSSLEP